jgi:hypothetical protein
MPKFKLFLSLILGLAVVFSQAGMVSAAPPAQDIVYLTGTVQSVVIDTDPVSGVQTVLVTLLVNGDVQTVRISIETAKTLTLVYDEAGVLVVDESWYGWDVDIDLETILSDEPLPPVPPAEEDQHPVGAKITEFFSGLFDVDYELVMSSHADGFGFGVITQALWITEKLGGDATLFQTILEAKKSGDYSLVALPDGTVPQNWGQFKKTVLKGEDDKNLGDIMSGGGDQPGNSGNNNGNGKPEDPPGQTKDKEKNNNKPAIPPGQNKDKNKDKDEKTK